MNTAEDLPDFPLELKSATSKEAAKLHAAALAASERLANLETAEREAEVAVLKAQEAFDTEVVASARSDMRPSVEAKLANDLASAKTLADPRTHDLRRQSALEARRDAVIAFNDYCRGHAGELLRDVQAEVEGTPGAYDKAKAAAEELLREPSARRQAAGELVRSLIACLGDANFPYPADWTVSDDPTITPMPPAALEVIERAKDAAAYDARREAEAEAVAREGERVAAEAAAHEQELAAAQEALNRLAARCHRGGVPLDEMAALEHGKHPLQIEVNRLKVDAPLSAAQDELQRVTWQSMHGHLDAEGITAFREGRHPAQLAVARLSTP